MLKNILIFFTDLYIVPVVFYFYAVLPECLACNGNTPTSLKVTDFWGNTVQCIGDDSEFIAYFHKLYLIFLGIITLPLAFGCAHSFRLRPRSS